MGGGGGVRGGVEVGVGGGVPGGVEVGGGPALNLGSGRRGESARRPRGDVGGESGVDLGDEVAVGKDEPRG